MRLDARLLAKVQCPISKQPLMADEHGLVTVDGAYHYSVTDEGVPLFAKEFCSPDAMRQQQHYDDEFAQQYLTNLSYPHTQEYMEYLDAALIDIVGSDRLNEVAEVCCGGGEAIGIFGKQFGTVVGVDISEPMLRAARTRHADARYAFLQGDATALPLKDECVDSVFMLGGIHHVNDRDKLFSEVARILRPGGRFVFREPVSDFFLWQWLRAVIYKWSPSLDAETERPLLFEETDGPLSRAGLRIDRWKTFGFLGYCFLMNSDVLVFNRLFRFVPGIRAITRMATRFDGLVLRIPGMARNGLIVIGTASKPMSARV